MKTKITRIVLMMLTMLVLALVIAPSPVMAASITSTGTGGNWGDTTTWQGGTIPTASDDVTIAAGATVVVNTTATARSISLAGGGNTTTVSISGTNSVMIGAGGLVINPAGDNKQANLFSVGAGNLVIQGNLAINGGNGKRYGAFSIGTGTVTVSGDVSCAQDCNQAQISFAGTGTLTMGGNWNFDGELNPGTGTIVFDKMGAQTISPQTHNNSSQAYNNLVLSGSGVKTLSGNVTINGTLSLQGTATMANGGFTLAYGTSAALEYKGSAAQTTGTEFPVTWVGTGGVVVNNSNGVGLNASRTINTSLALVAGDLTTNAYTLTMGLNATTTGMYDVVGVTCRNAFGGSSDNTYGSAFTIISGFAANPTAMCVQMLKQTPAYTGLYQIVARNYVLTMTGGSATNATVQLHYRDSADTAGAGCGANCPTTVTSLKTWRWDTASSRWILQAGSNTVNGNASYISMTGVSSFSIFGIAQNNSTTAVKLSKFEARSTDFEASFVFALIGMIGMVVLGGIRLISVRRR